MAGLYATSTKAAGAAEHAVHEVDGEGVDHEDGDDQVMDEHREQDHERARDAVRKVAAVARLRGCRRLVAP